MARTWDRLTIPGKALFILIPLLAVLATVLKLNDVVTFSILLAVLAARKGSDHPSPSMVLPTSAHAAFHKAAAYLGVRAVLALSFLAIPIVAVFARAPWGSLTADLSSAEARSSSTMRSC